MGTRKERPEAGWVDGLGPDPYFQVRLVGSDVLTEGDPEVLLGHRLADEAGHPGGNWVEWRWRDGALSVSNDQFGALPIYYAASGSSIAIARSIDRLLALGADRELDLDALAAFLSVGYYMGTDTLFKSIRVLPPACSLTWRAGELSLRSTPPKFSSVEMTWQQASDGVTELMRQAVARRIPDAPADYVMTISGGRDSRHILLELMRQGHRPRLTVTADHYPFDWGGDVPFGAQLAGALGVEHAIVRPGPAMAAEQRKNRLISYGSLMHAWFLPVADMLTAQTDYTYEGLAGGSLLERRFVKGKLKRLAAAGRWDELAAWMGKKGDGQARYAPLLAEGVRSQLSAERGAARIRAELERHLGMDDPFMSYRIWNRTMRELTLTPNAMLRGVAAVYTPYMDADLMAFAMSISSEQVDRAFHDELLATAYPAVAHVPYRPMRWPNPSRRYLRGLATDLLRMLWQESDGSLVDRGSMIRRASAGMVSGGDWFSWGRRFSLLVYLVQLEGLTRSS